MANSKKGLGINPESSSLTSPCPRMINVYFRNQLKYSKTSPDNPNCKNPFYVKYIKTLSYADNPVRPDLLNFSCTSNIVIDLYTGSVVDNYFKINNGKPIRSYKDCPNIESLVLVFKWHLNLVHMSREYIKCGWLQRKSVQKEIENAKQSCYILNKVGTTDLLNKAKPEGLSKEDFEEDDFDTPGLGATGLLD